MSAESSSPVGSVQYYNDNGLGERIRPVELQYSSTDSELFFPATLPEMLVMTSRRDPRLDEDFSSSPQSDDHVVIVLCESTQTIPSISDAERQHRARANDNYDSEDSEAEFLIECDGYKAILWEERELEYRAETRERWERQYEYEVDEQYNDPYAAGRLYEAEYLAEIWEETYAEFYYEKEFEEVLERRMIFWDVDYEPVMSWFPEEWEE